MSKDLVKLTYMAAQYRVKAELTKALCLAQEKAPLDLLDRAKSKMEAVKAAGEIAEYSVYREQFSQVWELIRRHPTLKPDDKIVFTLAEGAPALDGISVTFPSANKVVADISITSSQHNLRKWRLEWIIYYVNQRIIALGINEIANPAQIHGAVIKAMNGLEVKNLSLTALPPLVTDQAAKAYSIVANKTRQEVYLLIRDLMSIYTSFGPDKMAEITDEAVKKVGAQLGMTFYLQKKEFSTYLTSVFMGPEKVGLSLPVCLLAATTIRPKPQAVQNTSRVFNTAYAGAGKLNISFSSDNFEATVESFDMNLYRDRSFVMNREWVTNELRRNGILEEYYAKYIDDIIATLAAGEDITGKMAAEGVKSKRGTKPFLHPIFAENSSDTQTTDGDDKVDIRNMQQKSIVRAGQLVAVTKYKEAPVIGKDVFGNDLDAETNEELNVTIGEGIEARAGGKFYAISEGIPIVEKTSISLSKVMIHQGDVNLRTGNIIFDGPVEITGSIDSGARVEVLGDLTVNGNIRGAFVRCGGNLKVKSGITAGNNGWIYAKGEVSADFIENTTLQCGGDLIAKRIIINSKIICGGSIKIKDDQTGVVAGGSISCRENLSTGFLGFKHGNVTQINIGVDWKIELSVKIRSERLEKLAIKQAEDRAALREVLSRTKTQMTPKHQQRKDFYQGRLQKIRTTIEKMEKHLANAKSRLVYDPNTIIFVHQTVYANCNINVGGSQVSLKQDMAGVGILGKRKHGSYVVSIQEAIKISDNRDG